MSKYTITINCETEQELLEIASKIAGAQKKGAVEETPPPKTKKAPKPKKEAKPKEEPQPAPEVKPEEAPPAELPEKPIELRPDTKIATATFISLLQGAVKAGKITQADIRTHLEAEGHKNVPLSSLPEEKRQEFLEHFGISVTEGA